MTKSVSSPKKKQKLSDGQGTSNVQSNTAISTDSNLNKTKRKAQDDLEPQPDTPQPTSSTTVDATVVLDAALSKQDKAKAKKRRKEEQRALVRTLQLSSSSAPLFQAHYMSIQENPPSFSFDTRGFKGGRMIQVKVNSYTGHHRGSPVLIRNHTQDVRDFVLHLLADEKAQQWLYVAVSLRRSPDLTMAIH